MEIGDDVGVIERLGDPVTEFEGDLDLITDMVMLRDPVTETEGLLISIVAAKL